jgi:CubicO group peptidase (beta-lactamase class C family)
MRFLFLSAALLGLVVPAQTQVTPRAAASPNLARLDAYIEKARAEWDVPGLAVAIVKEGRVVLAKGYGVKQKGGRERVDGETLFAIASNTKAFTVAALAILVDERRLEWQERVQEILPYFQLYDPWVSRDMRVEDLLCHRAGLKTFSGDLLWYGTSYSREEILRRARYLKPAYPFRDGYGYSNLMFMAAGEVVARKAGMSWDEFVRQRLFVPLGMRRTTSSVRHLAALGNYAQPHASFEGPVEPIEWVNWDAVAPAGGIISCVNDMTRWLELQLGGGTIEGRRIFSEAAQRTMWTPHNVMSGPAPMQIGAESHFSMYGLGWVISDFRGRFTVSHGGAADGMFSQVWMMPEERLGVVVLTNCDRGVAGPIVNRIRDVYLGLGERDYSAEAVAGRRKAKVERTLAPLAQASHPPITLEQYAGAYGGPMYGDATVAREGGRLLLKLLPNPDFVADLTPIGGDAFTLKWRKRFAFFAGGRAQFMVDPAGRVMELKLDIPNNDFWFDELEFKKKS